MCMACIRRYDHSALEAINQLAAKYGEVNKRVHLRHLSSDCAALLERLNGEAKPYELIEADPATDPIYELAEDYSKYKGVAVPTAPEPSRAEPYEAAQEIF